MTFVEGCIAPGLAYFSQYSFDFRAIVKQHFVCAGQAFFRGHGAAPREAFGEAEEAPGEARHPESDAARRAWTAQGLGNAVHQFSMRHVIRAQDEALVPDVAVAEPNAHLRHVFGTDVPSAPGRAPSEALIDVAEQGCRAAAEVARTENHGRVDDHKASREAFCSTAPGFHLGAVFGTGVPRGAGLLLEERRFVGRQAGLPARAATLLT